MVSTILVVLVGVLPNPEIGTRVTSGVGFGQYIQQQKDGPRLRVPFEEVGVEARVTTPSLLVWGLQASVRGDAAEDVEIANPEFPRPPAQPGADPIVGPDGGARWRVAPFVYRRWDHVRAKLGVVAGNYYDTSKLDDGRAQLFPVAMIGTGNDEYSMELGLFDSPAVASAASGGLGALSVRASVKMARGNHLMAGVGCSMQPIEQFVDVDSLDSDDRVGYFAFGWRAALGRNLLLDVGGYVNDDIHGGYASLGFGL